MESIVQRFREAGQLRRLRESAGLSQRQLADALGVAMNTVSRWETGQRRISDLTWRAIESVVGKVTKP